jgi:hypothetical protein
VPVVTAPSAELDGHISPDGAFAARISPDGSWVAHMQRGADRVDVLQARNLQTGETRVVSRTVPLPIRSGRFPIDWAAQRVTWAPAGALLYFVEESSGQQAIARVDLSAPSSPAAVLLRTPRESGQTRSAGDVHPFIQAIDACKEGLRSRDREVRKAAIMALDKYIHGGTLPELSITKSGSDCNHPLPHGRRLLRARSDHDVSRSLRHQ